MNTIQTTTGAGAESADTLKAGDSFSIFINQGERDGWVLAVQGGEFLGAYRMPAGRVSLIVEKVDASLQDRTYRSVSLKGLPKKWQAAIAAQGGSLTVDDALDALGYNLEPVRGRVSTHQIARRDWAKANRVPQWVQALNAPVALISFETLSAWLKMRYSTVELQGSDVMVIDPEQSCVPCLLGTIGDVRQMYADAHRSA